MKTPCLTAAIVNDDDALATAINELLLGSKTIRRLPSESDVRKSVFKRSWIGGRGSDIYGSKRSSTTARTEKAT